MSKIVGSELNLKTLGCETLGNSHDACICDEDVEAVAAKIVGEGGANGLTRGGEVASDEGEGRAIGGVKELVCLGDNGITRCWIAAGEVYMGGAVSGESEDGSFTDSRGASRNNEMDSLGKS